MDYNTFTHLWHLADDVHKAHLKKRYPFLHARMTNTAWSIIGQIRARKKDKIIA